MSRYLIHFSRHGSAWRNHVRPESLVSKTVSIPRQLPLTHPVVGERKRMVTGWSGERHGRLEPGLEAQAPACAAVRRRPHPVPLSQPAVNGVTEAEGRCSGHFAAGSTVRLRHNPRRDQGDEWYGKGQGHESQSHNTAPPVEVSPIEPCGQRDSYGTSFTKGELPPIHGGRGIGQVEVLPP